MTHTTATDNTTSDIGRYDNPNAVAADIVKLKLGNGQVIATAECIGTAPEFKCDVQTTDGGRGDSLDRRQLERQQLQREMSTPERE